MVFMFLLVSRDSFGLLLIKKAAICLLMAVTNRCLRDNNFVEPLWKITGYSFLNCESKLRLLFFILLFKNI